MKKQFRIFAAALAALSVISVSGCAISAALEEENGFKYNSSQVSKEEAVGDITYHNVSSPSVFGGISAPSIFSDYTEKPYGIVEGDIYVSVNGSDETGDGSKSNPYATVTKAQSVIREMKAENKLPSGGLTVSIMAGEYRLSEGLVFTEEDSGTADCPITYAAYGDGEVVFKGSMKLNASDFTAVGDDIKAILPDESKDKVLMIDLSKYGITKDQLHIYDIGSHTWVSSYDSSYVGINEEILFNREALTLARYPNNDELLVISELVDLGDAGTKTPAVFKMKSDTAEHVKTWHSFDEIWCIGVFWGDWDTISSRVSFDFNTNSVIYETNQFGNSGDRAPHRTAPYIFYNVLDELDVPGEYYIDRENCIMYMYPTGDMADAEIEIVVDFDDTMLSGDKLENVTFMGLTFFGSKGSGILAYDTKSLKLYRCKFYGVGGIDGYAAEIDGYNCSIIDCEAHYVFANGFSVGGGDKETFTNSNSVLENCYVTHWGLRSIAGSGALSIGGCGTAMRHCEAAYSTANAGCVWNAESVCEYNIFHDCTTWATDMGAFYYGDSIMGAPNVTVRYNIFYNIGSEYAKPRALYWDHGHGNQRAYGNLFVNITGHGIIAGGGRNNSIMGNIIVNSQQDSIYYNDAMLWGYAEGHEDEYFRMHYSGTTKNQLWFDHIAYLQFINLNDDEPHDAYFLLNPAMNHISDNIIMTTSTSIGNIFTEVWQYSIIKDNYLGGLGLNDLTKVFVDPAKGDYRVREDSEIWDTAIGFKDIPYHLIGRY